jgi:hypothetical protein
MRQQASCARFRLKPRQQFRARQAGAFFTQFDGFYGDGPPDDRVCRLIDHTHGAAAQFTDNFVTSGL